MLYAKLATGVLLFCKSGPQAKQVQYHCFKPNIIVLGRMQRLCLCKIVPGDSGKANGRLITHSLHPVSQTVTEPLSSVCVLQTSAVFTVDVSHCLEEGAVYTNREVHLKKKGH